MTQNLLALATRLHRRIPGLIRAALRDAGISDAVVNRRLIGWHGKQVVVPVQDRYGTVLFFERWKSPDEAKGRLGVPAAFRVVDLYPWPGLRDTPVHVVVCQGVLEALVLESQGFTAITATGTGTVFKKREWAPAIVAVPFVFIAYHKGREGDVLAYRLQQAVPHARRVGWPDGIADGQGVVDFFVRLRKSPEDFRELLSGGDTAAA